MLSYPRLRIWRPFFEVLLLSRWILGGTSSPSCPSNYNVWSSKNFIHKHGQCSYSLPLHAYENFTFSMVRRHKMIGVLIFWICLPSGKLVLSNSYPSCIAIFLKINSMSTWYHFSTFFLVHISFSPLSLSCIVFFMGLLTLNFQSCKSHSSPLIYQVIQDFSSMTKESLYMIT